MIKRRINTRFQLSKYYYFYHFETNSTYYLYSGIFAEVACRAVGLKFRIYTKGYSFWRCLIRQTECCRHSHRQKYFWLLNFNRLLQPKVKIYLTYFFKVRMFYERFKSEQHLKKDRTTKGRGLEFLRR